MEVRCAGYRSVEMGAEREEGRELFSDTGLRVEGCIQRVCKEPL